MIPPPMSNFVVSSKRRIRCLRLSKILGTLLFLICMYQSYTVFFPKVTLFLDAATREEEILPTIQQQRRQGGEEHEISNSTTTNTLENDASTQQNNNDPILGIRSKNVTLSSPNEELSSEISKISFPETTTSTLIVSTEIRNNNNTNNKHTSSFTPLPNSHVILYNTRGNSTIDDIYDDENITNTHRQQQQQQQQRPQCQIGSNWKFLSSGGSAFTFRADLACWNVSEDIMSISEIVVRLQTRSENNATTNRLDRYIKSASGRKNEELIHFFRQLQGNWTTQEFENHFVAQVGIVQIDCDFLRNTQNVPLRDTSLVGVHWSTRCGSGNSSIPITGELYNFAPGKKMDFSVVDALSTTRRSEIVKNIIFKFRHMYNQQVMHCDLNTQHILLEEMKVGDNGEDNDGVIIKTRLIDFERHRSVAQIGPASKKRHFQRNQLWQLLYMIGFICGRRKDSTINPPDVHTGSCRMKPMYPVPMMKELLPFMEQCEFEKGRPLEWNSDYLTRDTSGAYNVLATWAGISSET